MKAAYVAHSLANTFVQYIASFAAQIATALQQKTEGE